MSRFNDGDTVTPADLFPGVEDQADIDALTRRLMSLNAIVPIVEFATPEPAPVAPEVIQPIPVVSADHAELAADAANPKPEATMETFKVPTFRPTKVNDAK
jgi:hypothetical protein